MILGIMGNPTKPRFAPEVSAFICLLRERKIDFIYDQENPIVAPVDPHELVEHDKIGEKADLVLSFGGDGTLLRTAAAVAPYNKPILGVNLGPGLGYMTDLTPKTLAEMIDDVLSENFDVEERMMIQAEVGGEKISHYALNDFVIGQSEVSRTLAVEISIDSLPASAYRADGLIIASPTGSTAYSLSAGGPILEPTLHAIIITPICPHTLTMRPMAVSDRRKISIRVQGTAILTADGEEICHLVEGREVVISKSSRKAHLVNILGRDFYHVLRDKLNWGAVPDRPQS